MQIILPWFNRVLNPNVTSHWTTKAKARKLQRHDAFWVAKQAGKPASAEYYYLSIIFHPPVNRGRDIDNCLAAIKGALDGIAAAWGINDKLFRFEKVDFGEVIKNGRIIINVRQNI